MATQLLKIVAPSGGDYTSLDSCVDANEKDLTLTGSDEYFDIQIEGTWTVGENNTNIRFDGYTCDSTHYIYVYTTSSCRHLGYVDDSSPYYRTTAINTDNFYFAGDYVTLEGIMVINTYSSGSGINTDNSSTNLTFDRCVFQTVGTSIKTNYSTATIRNCVCVSSGYHAATLYATTLVENCVFACTDVESGIYRGDGTITVKNTYAYGAGVGDAYSGSMTMTTCASNDGSNSTTTVAYSTSSGAYFTNVTAGSEDFHITSSSSDLYRAGTGLQTDFTNDIDGDTRILWDIGVDYIDSGTVVLQEGTAGYTGSYNTTLYTGDKSSDYPDILYIREAAGYYYPILIWDISNLPSGITITSATMSIYIYEEYNTSVNANCGYIEDPDDSGGWTVGDADEASWNEKKKNTNIKWETATTDIEDVLSATVDTQDISSTGWVDFDVTTEVQSWVDGTYNNLGFWINEASASNARAYSNANGTASNRPKLSITYTTGGGASPGIGFFIGVSP